MQTIKPGILVSLKTHVQGGVSYVRDKVQTNVSGRTEEKNWHTSKTIADVQEFEAAVQARAKISSLVRGGCIKTAFGLLCPNDWEEGLSDRIERAKLIANEYNETATITNVSFHVLKGRIAENDREATEAIMSDVKDLADQMREGIATANVKTIRDAAKKAKEMTAMLDETESKRVTEAVDAARKAAREITRRVIKGEELAEVVLADLATQPIDSLRMMSLDFDSDETNDTEAVPVIVAKELEVE